MADVLTRIQKLLALSKSANEHEAAAAALAVARLLAEHRLSNEEVDSARVMERTISLSSEPWVLLLANVVAQGCGCRLVLLSQVRGRVGETGRIVGTSLDTEAAQRLFSRVETQVRRVMVEGWKAHVVSLTDPYYGTYPSLLEPGAEAEWKASFALGAVEVVRDRLLKSPLGSDLTAETVALARLDLWRDAAWARVDQYLKAQWPAMKPVKGGALTIHLGALRAGRGSDVG